jgi:hypothetical protein
MEIYKMNEVKVKEHLESGASIEIWGEPNSLRGMIPFLTFPHGDQLPHVEIEKKLFNGLCREGILFVDFKLTVPRVVHKSLTSSKIPAIPIQ